jgi:hypothetical protein
MLKTIWLALAAFTLLWGQGCTQKDRVPASSKESKVAEFDKATVLEVPASQMRQNIVDLYRLKPDHRFSLAFGELHYYLRGGQGEGVNLIRALDKGNEKWLVKVGGRDAGHLPDYPKINDVVDSLGEWGRSITPAYSFHRESRDSEDLKKIRAQMDYFLAPYLFTGLRQADRLWQKQEGDIEALKISAEMLTQLYFQTPDLLEVSDILGAKALALLAILKTFARETPIREEALLSKRMGYEKHAIILAASLPDNDVVKQYILKNDEALKLEAASPTAITFTKFLWLSRLAENGDQTGWEEYRQQHFNFNTSIVSAHATSYERLEHNPFLIQASLASLMDTMDPATVQSRSSASAKEVAELLANRRFDEGMYTAMLGNMNQYSRGPFLDKRTFSAYANSSLQSNLFYSAKQEIQKLYSKGESAFRLALVDATTGEFSKNLSSWYSELYRQYAKRDRELSPAVYKNPIMMMGYRPALFAYRLAQSLEIKPSLAALRFMTAQLDTRPTHLYLMSEVAIDGLYDNELAKEITRQIASVEDPSTSQRLLNLRDENKLDELFAASVDAQKPIDYRLMAARLLFTHPDANQPRLREIYRGMLKANGEYWEVREAYLEFLEKNNLFKAAEIVIRDYLKDRDLANGGFDYLRAKVAMARIYNAQERNEDATREIDSLLTTKAREIVRSQILSLGVMKFNELDLKPVHPLEKAFTQQNYLLRRQIVMEVIARPVRYLLESGKTDESDRIVSELFKDFESLLELRALKAQVLWAKHDWPAASRLLNLHPTAISSQEWSEWVARSYRAQNSHLDQIEADVAFESMAREKFSNDKLLELVSAVDIPELPISKPKGWLNLKNESPFGQGLWQQYVFKKQSDTPENAYHFLTEKVPKPKRNGLSVDIFGSEQDELLWTFIETPEDGGQSEYVWLLRAAAHLRAPIKDPARTKALQHYYAHEGSTYYFTIGRHLTGFISEQQAFAIATGGKERCELAFFLGFKAEYEGRWKEASNWYRVVMETELVDNSEYVWAVKKLKDKVEISNQILSRERYVTFKK